MKFYLNTSVFGGYYDPEFSEDTMRLFEEIITNKFRIVRSSLLDEEIENAPRRVEEVIKRIPIEQTEYVKVDQEVITLASTYVKEGPLTKKFEDDAIHIALATIHRVDTLVSWNFRHMVSFFRIRQYNSVNLKLGYTAIDIRSPKEVHHLRMIYTPLLPPNSHLTQYSGVGSNMTPIISPLWSLASTRLAPDLYCPWW